MELIFHGKFSLYDAAIFLHKVSSFVYLFTICKFFANYMHKIIKLLAYIENNV